MILKVIIVIETLTLIYVLIKWHSCVFTLDVIVHYLNEHHISVNEEEIKKAIVGKVYHNSSKNKWFK